LAQAFFFDVIFELVDGFGREAYPDHMEVDPGGAVPGDTCVMGRGDNGFEFGDAVNRVDIFFKKRCGADNDASDLERVCPVKTLPLPKILTIISPF
jgi:hypothetical protein